MIPLTFERWPMTDDEYCCIYTYEEHVFLHTFRGRHLFRIPTQGQLMGI